ncbi:hypothetical protein EYF80_063107 [Liparis tanakae]|uniref:Uncharacterized protein n=1 Tax=Liparis tanakae TaxID=230148 RepID=A0A4Z2ED23_9TELE|nr:hypothetical protein EYF80_063107 [Liparis tanakae]
MGSLRFSRQHAGHLGVPGGRHLLLPRLRSNPGGASVPCEDSLGGGVQLQRCILGCGRGLCSMPPEARTGVVICGFLIMIYLTHVLLKCNAKTLQ